MRQAGRRAGQAVEITTRLYRLLAAQVLDDPLLGLAPFAHVFDQVDVGVGADALLSSERILASEEMQKRQEKSCTMMNNLAPQLFPDQGRP